MRERDEGGPAAGVRTLSMRFSRPGGREATREGRVVGRLGGLGGWPMAMVPERW